MPRMLGATILAINYNKYQTNEAKDALYQHIITQYTLQGFRYNGKNLNIYQLAQTLLIPPEKIIKYIQLTGRHLGTLVDPKKIQETLQSIISLSTNWAISDRGEAVTYISSQESTEQEN